ncbi:MAG: hypothetical protein R3B91_14685 [Planctomycetaceae bacterium]
MTARDVLAVDSPKDSVSHAPVAVCVCERKFSPRTIALSTAAFDVSSSAMAIDADARTANKVVQNRKR